MTRGFTLSGLLTPERVKLPLEAREKRAVIRELSALAARSAGAEDRAEEVAESVLERESELSTGIGGGVALPHARTGAVPGLCLVAGTAPEGVDFQALDGRPVRLLFLLAGPVESAGDHVRALSRLSRILSRAELRERLVGCDEPEEFLDVLREAESA